jgi:nitrous oxide reductase accessory protein NosL
MKIVMILLSILIIIPGSYVEIKKDDRCAVCGMHPYKHPKWRAEILLKEGSYIPFDSPKCMFKYYLNMKDKDKVDSIYVIDYYRLKPIDAKKAYFVVGSDVYGPMGNDFIPVESRKEAEEFIKDHNGKKILKFDEVNGEVIKEIEE